MGGAGKKKAVCPVVDGDLHFSIFCFFYKVT